MDYRHSLKRGGLYETLMRSHAVLYRDRHDLGADPPEILSPCCHRSGSHDHRI